MNYLYKREGRFRENGKIIRMPSVDGLSQGNDGLPVFTLIRTLDDGRSAGLIRYKSPGTVDILCDDGSVLESMDFRSFLKGKAIKAEHGRKSPAKIIRFRRVH